MITRFRHLVALTAAAGLAILGCSSTPRRTGADDYHAALRAAIASIESSLSHRPPPSSPSAVTLVLSSAITPELRRACIALRHTVFDYNLPDLDQFALPPGYLQPESLVIGGDTAVFKGLLGPVPATGTPASRSACGRGYEVELVREPDGAWRAVSRRMHICRLPPVPPPRRAA